MRKEVAGRLRQGRSKGQWPSEKRGRCIQVMHIRFHIIAAAFYPDQISLQSSSSSSVPELQAWVYSVHQWRFMHAFTVRGEAVAEEGFAELDTS